MSARLTSKALSPAGIECLRDGLARVSQLAASTELLTSVLRNKFQKTLRTNKTDVAGDEQVHSL